MEKYYFSFFESYYSQQLMKAKDHIAIKHYRLGIDIYSRLIEQLHQDTGILKEALLTKAHTVLNLCHALRQHTYFTWLIDDNASFCQNKEQHVKELLYDCKLILRQNTIYHPGDNEHSIRLKHALVHLLFNKTCFLSSLRNMQQNFCTLHDKFQQNEDPINQSLALLGLALINAYEGRNNVFQGLKVAVNLNSLLKPLIQAIRFQLPDSMHPTAEESCLLNPLFNFRRSSNSSFPRLL